MEQFSGDFLKGAATAAHQVEGNNTHSDFWAQEQMPHSAFVEKSGDACDHYNRYREDIRLLADAGLNAYRFSIEWARIEPEDGLFDEKEMKHYEDVIDCCRDYGVEPIVTLHHFSSPVWLIQKGGWEAETVPDDFARYVSYVADHIGSKLHYVCTINEANMGLQVAAIIRRYMVQAKAAAAKAAADGAGENTASDGDTTEEGQVQVGMNLAGMQERMKQAAMENAAVFGTPQPKTFTGGLSQRGDELVMEAHKKAREILHEKCPDAKVGLTLSLHDIQFEDGGEEQAERAWNEEFRHYLPVIGEDDFLGVQNYTRSIFGPDGQLPNPPGAKTTQMGYEIFPQALENVIRKVAREFSGDLIVTENGIATADDTQRCEFIREATDGVKRCLADGIPVKGYLYWSLMDNFEWQKGYSMTFGLVAVDRKNDQKRMPKESLSYLGSL